MLAKFFKTMLFVHITDYQFRNCLFVLLKLRSHQANGRETDKKSFHPFVSGGIRFMSVSNPVNPFLVR